MLSPRKLFRYYTSFRFVDCFSCILPEPQLSLVQRGLFWANADIHTHTCINALFYICVYIRVFKNGGRKQTEIHSDGWQEWGNGVSRSSHRYSIHRLLHSLMQIFWFLHPFSCELGKILTHIRDQIVNICTLLVCI